MASTALPSPLEVCLWDWTKSKAYNRKVDTTYELLARILGAAARIKTCEYQLRLATHDLRARFVKCTEVDGWIFEHVLRTVTNFSFLCSKCY